jgi:hypothetical protein
MKGLDPVLLPGIVARARRQRLRVSAHISNAADFHMAVEAGVDEIVHSGSPSPFNTIDNANISPELVKNPAALGAQRSGRPPTARLGLPCVRGDYSIDRYSTNG